MKKVISILMVLCIAASLFAASGTLKVGGAFDFVTGKTGEFNSEDELGNKAMYKAKGFGFDISGRTDISPVFDVWSDVNMVFASNMDLKQDGANDWYSLDTLAKLFELMVGQTASKSVHKYSISVGVAFKLPVAETVNVSVGGGVFFDSLVGKVSASVPENTNAYIHNASATYKFMNLGLTTYADVTCLVAENIGISLTAMPRVGVFNMSNITSVKDTDTDVIKASSFAFSFGMPVSVGASYSF